MIEFAHYVVKAALERNWEELLATPQDRWLEALSFGQISHIYSDAFTRFVTREEKVTFFTHWNPRMFETSKHVIAISNDSEVSPQEVLGYGHTMMYNLSATGSDTYTDIVDSELGVYIASPQADTCSFLHRFVRRALLQQTLWVIAQANLEQLRITNSTALVCPPELVQNGIPTMYGRRVGLSCRAVDAAGRMGDARTETSKNAVLVLDEQDQVDALDRETRVETDLGGVYQGKVRIR